MPGSGRQFSWKDQPVFAEFPENSHGKGLYDHFPHCCESYEKHYNEDHNILSVKAVTAVPLSEKQAQALTQKLTRTTGKTIVLTNRVDPTCLGGVRLDYDGQRLDDTISHRMDSVRELLKNTVL